ncbi:SH3 domain-containing protein [Rathayibacter soli]|uniref:SH3 domain-containing protein n=1 Tax=Rathayibacter soli TaxID=3144168 RepID=UPI0027E3E831|nr:SH3 domain-containing protein [Glaciibacter superstes]
MSVRTIVAASLIAAGLLGVTAAAAITPSAGGVNGPVGGLDQTNSVITQATTSFTAPSTQAQQVHTLQLGERVDAICHGTGQTVNGNSDWVRIAKDGTTGYVYTGAITAPTNLPLCSA